MIGKLQLKEVAEGILPNLGRLLNNNCCKNAAPIRIGRIII